MRLLEAQTHNFTTKKSPICFLSRSPPLMMLGSQLCPRSTVCGLRSFTDHPTPILRLRNSFPSRLSFRLLQGPVNSSRPKSVVVTCKYSRGSFSPKSHHDRGSEYLEASVLIPETVKHYHLLKKGFQEEVNWNLSGHFPVSQAKDCRTDINSLGFEFLRRFQTPTIFLKISCDGDFLLPVVVGEFAVERLMDSVHKDDSGDCPNLFQFARNLVTQLGYQVNMVKITEGVVNTYYARIYFTKAGERENFSIDARPSDAINLARRCKAPIYVNKQVVLMDAIRVSYRAGHVHGAKPCYDVLLDSAPDGPDLLAEELDFVKNLQLAVQDERYFDAALWRDKLVKLRKSG